MNNATQPTNVRDLIWPRKVFLDGDEEENKGKNDCNADGDFRWGFWRQDEREEGDNWWNDARVNKVSHVIRGVSFEEEVVHHVWVRMTPAFVPLETLTHLDRGQITYLDWCKYTTACGRKNKKKFIEDIYQI